MMWSYKTGTDALLDFLRTKTPEKWRFQVMIAGGAMREKGKDFDVFFCGLMMDEVQDLIQSYTDGQAEFLTIHPEEYAQGTFLVAESMWDGSKVQFVHSPLAPDQTLDLFDIGFVAKGVPLEGLNVYSKHYSNDYVRLGQNISRPLFTAARVEKYLKRYPGLMLSQEDRERLVGLVMEEFMGWEEKDGVSITTPGDVTPSTFNFWKSAPPTLMGFDKELFKNYLGLSSFPEPGPLPFIYPIEPPAPSWVTDGYKAMSGGLDYENAVGCVGAGCEICKKALDAFEAAVKEHENGYGKKSEQL